jgi:hypothetical protein
MNINIKKLITFLTLQVRNSYVNTIIGYLNSVNHQEGDWQFVVTRVVIPFDLAILKLLEADLENSNKAIKEYSKVFNDCYNFINEEFNISFIEEAPLNNNRVDSIQSFNNYILARRTLLKEYK